MLHPTKAGAQAGSLGFQKSQARPKATSGQAQGLALPSFFWLAWPGFWPQAGAGTSLVVARYRTHHRIKISIKKKDRHD